MIWVHREEERDEMGGTKGGEGRSAGRTCTGTIQGISKQARSSLGKSVAQEEIKRGKGKERNGFSQFDPYQEA
jgi:hypothetical protein